MSVPTAQFAISNLRSFIMSRRIVAPVLLSVLGAAVLGYFARWAANSSGATPHMDVAYGARYGEVMKRKCQTERLYFHKITEEKPQVSQSLQERIATADKSYISVAGITHTLTTLAALMPATIFASRLLLPYSAMEDNAASLATMGSLSSAERANEIGTIAGNVFQNGLLKFRYSTVSLQLLSTVVDSGIVCAYGFILSTIAGIDSKALAVNATLAYLEDKFGNTHGQALERALKQALPYDELVCEISVKAEISNIHEFSLDTFSETHLVLLYSLIFYELFSCLVYACAGIWICVILYRFAFWKCLSRIKFGNLLPRPTLVNFDMWCVCSSSSNAQMGKDVFIAIIHEDAKEKENRAEKAKKAVREVSGDGVSDAISGCANFDANADAASLNSSRCTVQTDSTTVELAIEMTEVSKMAILGSHHASGPSENETTETGDPSGSSGLGTTPTPTHSVPGDIVEEKDLNASIHAAAPKEAENGMVAESNGFGGEMRNHDQHHDVIITMPETKSANGSKDRKHGRVCSVMRVVVRTVAHVVIGACDFLRATWRRVKQTLGRT